MPCKDKIRRVEYARKYRQTHKLKRALQKKNYLLRLKQKVLTRYGNGKLACVRCGFDKITALSIDHINGNGNKHKEEEGIIGGKLYTWLKREKFPSGFQTLCMNCQYIKRVENQEYSRNLQNGIDK